MDVNVQHSTRLETAQEDTMGHSVHFSQGARDTSAGQNVVSESVGHPCTGSGDTGKSDLRNPRPSPLSFTDLPDEIMAKILHLAFPCVTLDTEEGPWAGSRICRKTRKLVLESPKLWQNIVIKSPSCCWEDDALEILETCLSRSGSAPLKITFRPAPHWRNSDALFVMLVAQCERWAEVRLTLSPIQMRHLHRVGWRTPELVYADIELDISSPAPRTTRTISSHAHLSAPKYDVFAHAPSLKVAKISSSSPSTFVLPWHLIEVLHCKMSSLPIPITLADMPRLEVYHIIDDGLEQYSPTLIRNSTVRTLSMVIPTNQMYPIAGSLLLPNLESAAFTVLRLRTRLAPIIRLLAQSSVLQSLYLHARPPYYDMIRLFRATEHLVQFDLVFLPETPPDRAGNIIDLLTCGAPGEDFLPRLRSLTIDAESLELSNYGWRQVLRMRASRRMRVVATRGRSVAFLDTLHVWDRNRSIRNGDDVELAIGRRRWKSRLARNTIATLLVIEQMCCIPA